MSPSGGETMRVDQPITWSPEKSSVAPGKAEVAAKMAGRVERRQRPVRAATGVAVAQAQVGGEGRRPALRRRPAAARQGGHRGLRPVARGAEGQDRRPGRGGKARGEGGMVAVGMGHDDVADALAGAERRQDRGQVRVGSSGPGSITATSRRARRSRCWCPSRSGARGSGARTQAAGRPDQRVIGHAPFLSRAAAARLCRRCRFAQRSFCRGAFTGARR